MTLVYIYDVAYIRIEKQSMSDEALPARAERILLSGFMRVPDKDDKNAIPTIGINNIDSPN